MGWSGCRILGLEGQADFFTSQADNLFPWVPTCIGDSTLLPGRTENWIAALQGLDMTPNVVKGFAKVN